MIEEGPDPIDHEAIVSYVLFPTSGCNTRESVDGNPLIPLEETLDHVTEYRVNYEPTLEMIADEDDRDIDAAHGVSRLRP